MTTQQQPERGQAPVPAMPHNLVVENRRNLTATGIKSIVNYDEYSATMETSLGTLVVGGEGLSVSELSIQTGEVKISGTIEYVQYTARAEKKGGLLARFSR